MIAVPKEEIASSKHTSCISDKDTGETKSEGWGNCFSVEEGSWKCGFFVVLNQKGGTKCATCETEKLGHKVKLYVSVSAYGGKSPVSSSIGAGGFKFGGLGLQGQPDGSSERNIFECSFTEEVTGAGKYFLEGGSNFSASEAKKKFNSTASAVQREDDRSASPSTQ